MKRWQHAGSVALAKVVASAVVLALGFRAVSDDDFARVEIAERFAHAPRWDASGTSWLPLPFWIVGGAMMALGRGLGPARAVAFALGVAAALCVYQAARWLGEDRGPAAAGATLAAVFPWSARLGVATVPELPTAALTLLAVAALTGEARDHRRLWGAAAIAAASLSRYEAWPIAAIFAVVTAVDAVRKTRVKNALAAGIALAGPLAWLVNNRAAHGDALHFLARVAAYKQALGGSEPGAASRLWAYPLAMITEEPEIAALLIVAAALLALRGALREPIARYAWPAAIFAAQIGALSLAMLKDGAPTHHPERAVLAALLLAATCAGALAYRAAAAGAWAYPALAGTVGLAALALRPLAKREPFVDREDQAAIGRAAAALTKPGEEVLIEVRDYGYLAVVAGLGRPEDARPERSIDPRRPIVPSAFDDPTAVTRLVATTPAPWVAARASLPVRGALGEPVLTRGGWGLFRVAEPRKSRQTGSGG